MAEQLSKIYEPKVTEKKANEIWSSSPYFHAQATDGEKAVCKSYTIAIPPPNVTAPLHLGHALNNTLQDILIRWRRMQGCNTLWMPGTDHAGIATQTVVEKRILAEEGKRRTDFKREDFVARVQAWKDEYEAMIISQLQAMGCSCDWLRTRFTMDDVCAKAVRAAFFKLFKDGLIYRGKRLVNWDPATQTVLADDEVEHETVQGHFWYMRYPLVESVKIEGKPVEHITVATTRPETMLGDTAVAMNPADGRAKYLIGKKVRLPIVGRIIPIIADDHVVLPNPQSEDEKAKYSTGFLKVTPAHDPDDWEIGQRHNLEVINVLAPDGTISNKFGWSDAKDSDVGFLLGMDRFEAREAIVEWFREEGLLEEIRPYTHEVGHSYRSHVPIEPYLSDQWYIAVKKPIEHLAAKFGDGLIEGTDVPVNSLAGLALKPLLDGRLRFTPQRYSQTYKNWLENLRDWPISRQLWWGHRIPVWRMQKELEDETDLSRLTKIFETIAKWREEGRIAGHTREKYGLLPTHLEEDEMAPLTFVCVRNPQGEDKNIINYLESNGFVQDTDVLDTWFSSALWPFSTLGWPDETPELKTFYPGDVLCTAREIITLWVSRMVMMGQYCVGDIPFSNVYIHAMIQDGEGRKMSKSLGNGIDPLVAIDSHGADAMRFTLASMVTETQDIRMPVESMTLPDGRTANTSPKFDIGRNFCNKLWNASRFAMMNLEGLDPAKFDKNHLTITDKWILSRLAQTIADVTGSLEEFKFSEPLMLLYKFFWNDFCDWYLEWIKPRIQNTTQKPVAQNILAFVLDQTLRLLHPFVPFITEGIFQKLDETAPNRGLKDIAEIKKADALAVAQWPQKIDFLKDNDAEKQIETIQTVIRAIRDLRSKYNKQPGEKLTASINSPLEVTDILNANKDLICQLAGLKEFAAADTTKKPDNSVTAIVEQMQVYLHNAVDVNAEKQRLEKQRQQIENAKKTIEAKLNNENFTRRAKPEIVEQTRQKLVELTEQLKTVEKYLAELKT